jgi:hypothetical protein
MYRYCGRAEICYAFREGFNSGAKDEKSMMDSRWWTRGWTLQELLGPREVIFYTSDWLPIATKYSLASRISKATSINEGVLKCMKPLDRVSVAQLMSWAAHRKTTRDEDVAYCLLGIFDVNIPVLYGEGSEAFLRLQEEILKRSSDQSLFAWTYILPSSPVPSPGVLFPHPRYFKLAAKIVPFKSSALFSTGTEPYTMTHMGLNIRLPLIPAKGPDQKAVAILACHSDEDFMGPLGIALWSTAGSRNVF